MNEPHAPLSEAELERDAIHSYFEAMRAIGEQVRQGRELPALFRPTRREAE